MVDFILYSAAFALQEFWPTVVAVVVVALAMSLPGSLPWPSRRVTVAAAIAGSAAAYVAIALPLAEPELFRDFLGALVFAIIAPSITAAIGAVLLPAPIAARFLGALVAGLLVVALSPLPLLVIHCTSGDCL